MQNSKVNELERIKSGQWPRDQRSIILIILAFIAGCIYLISSVLDVMEVVR
jgi:hypothetical protein